MNRVKTNAAIKQKPAYLLLNAVDMIGIVFLNGLKHFSPETVIMLVDNVHIMKFI